MATKNLNLGIVPISRGEFNSTTIYYKDNIVQYKRGSYQVVSESPIIGVPPTNDKNIVNPGWTLFAGTLDAQDVVNQIKEQEAKSIQAVANREAEILAKSDAAEVSFDNTGTSFSGTNVQDALKETNGKLSKLESGVIYDVTANNDGATFPSLSALLSSENLSTLIPTSVRHGGMSVRFVQSSDNKYVQYRLMDQTFSTIVSDWQGVDDMPTPGSDNLVKSGEVYSAVEGLELKVLNNVEIYPFIEVKGGSSYNESGYFDYANNATCKVTFSGTLSIDIFTDGYQYAVYKYISDSEGEGVYPEWSTNSRNIQLDGTYVFSFRHVTGSSVDSWNTTHSEYIRNLSETFSSTSNLENRNNVRITSLETNVNEIEQNLNGANVVFNEEIEASKRLTIYYDVMPLTKYTISFVSSDQSDINQLRVYLYKDTILVDQVLELAVGESGTIVIPNTANRLYLFIPNYASINTNVVINVSRKGINEKIEELQTAVFPSNVNVTFCDSIPKDVLTEMYFPNITSDWKITRCASKINGTVVLNLIDGDGNVTYKTALAGVISPFYVNGEIIGYFKIENVDGGYDITSSGRQINVNEIININNSPNIKKYLNREENIVLLGDSIFGYETENYLLEYLIKKTDKFIANAGFAGCRTAWRTSDGSDNWDKMTLVNVVDAIVNGDYTPQLSAIENLGRYQYFKDRIASLKAIDFTKPTTVIIGYGNNDITGGNLIGSLWDKTQTIADYDKTTYIGAMNYGIAKLSQAFPNVKIIVMNPEWRILGGTVDPDGGTSGDPIAPYEYTNSQGITFYQYLNAIKENCERCGVRLYDLFRMGGRCAFNWNYYSVDRSHFNMKGYEMLATVISEEVKKII